MSVSPASTIRPLQVSLRNLNKAVDLAALTPVFTLISFQSLRPNPLLPPGGQQPMIDLTISRPATPTHTFGRTGDTTDAHRTSGSFLGLLEQLHGPFRLDQYEPIGT
jgi:hypothetical protein